jgi:hypothetical protein
MKSRAIAILVFASLVCAGFVAPAFAQNPQAEAEYQHYLSVHPELRANPSLINDPRWLSQHQTFVRWLNQHPYIRNQAKSMGDYDSNRQWHDADWWHRNNPDWTYDHHPEWVRANPAWRNDGDWDDQHRWHDRNWWVNNNHAWVEQHHPNWAENQEHHEYQGHHEYNEAHPNYGESEQHHGNGHAYGHDKDHGDHGHGHDHEHND